MRSRRLRATAPPPGAEPSQAGLVVSDKPIDYIEVDKADVFVAFNEASFKTYYPKTKKDAIIFVDSTLVPKELYADIRTRYTRYRRRTSRSTSSSCIWRTW